MCLLKVRKSKQTLFTHLILFDVSFVFFDFVIIHMCEWILCIIRFVNHGIVLLIAFNDTFGCRTNDNNRFRCCLMWILENKHEYEISEL